MMSRQQKSLYLPLIGTILLGLLVGMYLTVKKRFSKPNSSAKITKHRVETPPNEVLKYWTADKQRNARPAMMPNSNAISQEKRQSPGASRPHQA